MAAGRPFAQGGGGGLSPALRRPGAAVVVRWRGGVRLPPAPAGAPGLPDRPVRTVMDPGERVVFPDDSVEQLQRTMVEHDWGQVPVVDRVDGRVIGIVTRTDLLRSLAGTGRGRPSPALEAELERALPPARGALLRLGARAAETRRAALYGVGGGGAGALARRAG